MTRSAQVLAGAGRPVMVRLISHASRVAAGAGNPDSGCRSLATVTVAVV